MPLEADYLGMNLRVEDNDGDNIAYFNYCAEHDFHLQRCNACELLVYPPRSACPWCAAADFRWDAVPGAGTVHSYGEVHHAIQPSFREHTPYQILLVELDTQRDAPEEGIALRVAGNTATPEGDLAPPDVVAKVGIGSRMRMVFKDLGPGLSLPMWTLDEDAEQPEPWRYPED